MLITYLNLINFHFFYKFFYFKLIILYFIIIPEFTGDWGLGIGDWGLGPIPILLYLIQITTNYIFNN